MSPSLAGSGLGPILDFSVVNRLIPFLLKLFRVDILTLASVSSSSDENKNVVQCQREAAGIW